MLSIIFKFLEIRIFPVNSRNFSWFLQDFICIVLFRNSPSYDKFLKHKKSFVGKFAWILLTINKLKFDIMEKFWKQVLFRIFPLLKFFLHRNNIGKTCWYFGMKSFSNRLPSLKMLNFTFLWFEHQNSRKRAFDGQIYHILKVWTPLQAEIQNITLMIMWRWWTA